MDAKTSAAPTQLPNVSKPITAKGLLNIQQTSDQIAVYFVKLDGKHPELRNSIWQLFTQKAIIIRGPLQYQGTFYYVLTGSLSDQVQSDISKLAGVVSISTQPPVPTPAPEAAAATIQIGRASCRERV